VSRRLLVTISQCGLTGIDSRVTFGGPEKTLTVPSLPGTCCYYAVNVCGVEAGQFREPGAARRVCPDGAIGIRGCSPGAALHVAGTTPFMLSVLAYLPGIPAVAEGAPGDSGMLGDVVENV
jgi:hypothetical protein